MKFETDTHRQLYLSINESYQRWQVIKTVSFVHVRKQRKVERVIWKENLIRRSSSSSPKQMLILFWMKYLTFFRWKKVCLNELIGTAIENIIRFSVFNRCLACCAITVHSSLLLLLHCIVFVSLLFNKYSRSNLW